MRYLLALLLLPGLVRAASSPGLAQANAQLEAGDNETAAQAYEKLGVQKPSKREGWRQNNWGLALLRLNKPALAVERLEAAVLADPRNFTARANLAAAWERVGDRVKAQDVYRRALELIREENKALLAGKGKVETEAKESVEAGRLSASAQVEEKASILKGEELKAALKAASDLLDEEDYKAAADAYAAIGQTAPAKREAWRLNNWGLCYLRMGDGENARVRLERSVEAFPDNPVAWNNLAAAYEALGHADKAKEAWAKAGHSAGEEGVDALRFELGRLKLDLAAERRRWEALSR